MLPDPMLIFSGNWGSSGKFRFWNSFQMTILIGLCLGLWMSCTLNPSLQTRGDQRLQGEWTETLSPEKQNPANLYQTRYSFRFECDSVFITTEVKSRFNYEDDHCFNGGHWTEYQKAGYLMRNDSLILEGVYTKPNFKMKISGCHHSGNFHESYLLSPTPNPDSLFLSSSHEHGLIHLFHEKKWNCKPHRLQ